MPIQGNCHLMPVSNNRVVAKACRISNRHQQPVAVPPTATPQQWPSFAKPETMNVSIQQAQPTKMQTPSMNMFNPINAGSLNLTSNETFYQQHQPSSINLGGHDVGWQTQQHQHKQLAYNQNYLSAQQTHEQQAQQTYWHQATSSALPLQQPLVTTCAQVSNLTETFTNVAPLSSTSKVLWPIAQRPRSSAASTSTYIPSEITSPTLFKKVSSSSTGLSTSLPVKSQSKRTMSSSTRHLVQHIHLSFSTNLLPNLRKCSKADYVSSYMETVSTSESINSNWMLHRFCSHREAVQIFARDVCLGLMPEEKGQYQVDIFEKKNEFFDMRNNWIEVLILRSAYYSVWNYSRQMDNIKHGQLQQQATNNNPEETEVARRRRQLQLLSIEPSLEDFWLLPNELLALRNPESALNLQRREALLDLAGTLRHYEVSEMEVALLAAWLLFHYDSAPADTEAKKIAKARTIAAKSQLFSTMAEYNDIYYADGKKRTTLLLTSITSAVGFAGGMLADF